MTVSLSGVKIGDVPTKFDIALGFDPGTSAATMHGYTLAKGSMWEQTPDLPDIQQLISVASPSQIDRALTNWPEISQGDWTMGERQQTFVNPQRYHSTDGMVDVSKPNALQLFKGPSTTTYTTNGSYNLVPINTDGSQYFVGIHQGGKQVVQAVSGTPTAFSIGDATEIYDWCTFPGGLHYGTSSGIWGYSAGNPPTVYHTESTDPISPTPCRSIAYLGGLLYFITSDGAGNLTSRIKTVAPGSGVGLTTTQVVANPSVPEISFSCICATSDGLFISATQPTLRNMTTLYTWSGDTGDLPMTRIEIIPGWITAAATVNGITYILARQYQASQDMTLYALSGSELRTLDDMRWLSSEFQMSGTVTTTARSQIWGDGRYLYIAIPGLGGRRLDLMLGGMSQVGALNTYAQTSISGHGLVATSDYGFVDVGAYGTTAKFTTYNQVPSSGALVTSYFDWGVGAGKFFRSLRINLKQVLASGQAIAVDYRVDNATSYTAATVQTLSNNQLIAYLPSGTKGTKIQFRLTLTGGSSASPIVDSIVAKANLGRVWKGVVQCHRGQEMNNGQKDDQGKTAQQLLGNLENIVTNAGRAIAFVPSYTATTGSEQVNVVLESYKIDSPKPGLRGNAIGAPDYEGVAEIVMKEDVS